MPAERVQLVYFWGAWDGSHGEALREPGGWRVRPVDTGSPWRMFGSNFCPTQTRTQGIARLHRKQHPHTGYWWSVVGFWDRSVDLRPCAASNFLAAGNLSFDEVIAFAREKFPRVWARFTFDVRLDDGSRA